MRTQVTGQYPTAGTPQPFDDFNPDTTCSDHSDRHVAEFPSGCPAQSIVMGL